MIVPISLIAGIIAVICALLIVYHHAIWPVFLMLLARIKADETQQPTPKIIPSELPSICVIIPVYNEVKFIADKLWNCAMLDYPPEKLRIRLIFDGCTDQTTVIARETLKNPIFRHLPIFLEIEQENHGKQAILTQAIESSNEEIIVLSDCSSMLSMDSLKRIITRFRDETLGVVCASYELLYSGSAGEQQYWKYQKKIKTAESKLGSVLGAHGACYAFRRTLYHPLPANTINDDFVLPMQIVKQGYRAIYDQEIIALELEKADEEFDFHRRIRIGAGNMQQCQLLMEMIHPRYGMTALSFFSGKVLRTAMPYVMLSAFILSGVASLEINEFLLLFVPQLFVYALVIVSIKLNITQGKLASLRYLVLGHLAGLIGSLRYFFTPKQLKWQEISS